MIFDFGGGITSDDGCHLLSWRLDRKPVLMNTRRFFCFAVLTEAQMELEALGTVEGARNQMADDMIRPANYAKISAPDQDLINEDDVAGFGVRFPDGEQFTANGTPQGRENINRIAEKIKNLCGDVHPRQTSSVMAMLSQAGMGVLVTNLASHGIKGNEHCVMDFSLSKNNETGDVFIRYSSPKGLKFAFEWTATVKIDGTVTTSPFQFRDEDTLKAKTDAAFEAFNKKISKYMGGKNGVAGEDCAAAARKLVDLAKDDLDLLQLLTENKAEAAKHILADSNNAFRTDEEIARRVKALRANVDELRMATKGDPHALKVAIRQLGYGNGKPLADGIITKMFKAARQLDLKPVKENVGSRSSLKHLEAFCQLRVKMYEAINSSSLLDGEEIGAEEKSIAERLALSAICPRLGTDAVRWLHDGMYSQDAPKIHDAIDRIRFNEARLPGYMNINNKITTFADEFYRAMYDVGASVMDSMLDIENPVDFQNFDGQLTVSNFRPVHDIVKRFALMDKPTGWEEAKVNAREAYRKFKRSTVDGVIAQALSLVADDPDARKLVIDHISLLLIRSNATLRPAEEVRERVRAILANVQELRALAKGDEGVFKAGIKLLSRLEGKTLPPGSFVNIFAGVNSLSVNDLKNVRPGCGVLKLHKAFRSFMDSTQTIMNGSNAGEILQEPLYRVPLKMFIGHLILAKCGRQNMQTLSDAMRGDEGGQLLQLYRDFQDQRTGYQTAGNDALIPMRMSILATQCADELNRLFDSLVAEAAGHDMDNDQGLDFDEEFEYDPNWVNDVGREFEAIVQENPQAYEPM